MSRRSSAPTSGQGQHPQAAPPASPLGEAAAAAASQPLPVPDARTDRGPLEGATRWLPGALQPAGMLLVRWAAMGWERTGSSGCLLLFAAQLNGRGKAHQAIQSGRSIRAAHPAHRQCLDTRAPAWCAGGRGQGGVDGGGAAGAPRLAPAGLVQPGTDLGLLEVGELVSGAQEKEGAWCGGEGQHAARHVPCPGPSMFNALFSRPSPNVPSPSAQSLHHHPPRAAGTCWASCQKRSASSSGAPGCCRCSPRRRQHRRPEPQPVPTGAGADSALRRASWTRWQASLWRTMGWSWPGQAPAPASRQPEMGACT